MTPLSLWEKNLIEVENGKLFVNCCIFDDISGKEIPNKFRRFETLVAEIFNGKNYDPKDFIRKIAVKGHKSTPVFLAAKVAKFIVLRGFKDFPWNSSREEFVNYFFHQDVIPYINPYMSNATYEVIPETTSPEDVPPEIASPMKTSESTKLQAIDMKITKTKPVDPVKTMLMSEEGFDGFIKQVKQSAIKRKDQGFTKKDDPNMVRKIVEELFRKRGSTEEFRHHLSLVMKTGNSEDIIKVIRTRLSIVGLGYNLVPCMRLVKKSTAEIQSYFTAMCEPERTFSGFRCNLTKCVEIVSFLLFGTNDIKDLRVDIWGDGCEIGGVETTRMAFRILSTEKIKCQSSNAVFCFAAYRGKDSRFAMEQNLGPTLAGVQESGWLFNKTLELSNRGVKLTYSGDSPFLIRLVLGITNETSTPSKIPLHVTDSEYTPTLCDPETGLRSDVVVPFRTDLPRSSLVYFESVQSICPDVTHMTTRCVENDIQKIAQKIIREKYPHHDLAIRQLEENLTRRDAKRPYFQFNITHKSGSLIGTVGPVSLAGSNALAVIADKEELSDAKDGSIGDLYQDVWDPTDLILGSEGDVPCVKVLRSWYPELFIKDNPKQIGSSDKFISAYDACELLRSSLNQCVLCLRAEEFNCGTFVKWAETYYQINILLFGHAGLTPYKLKMMIFPQLVENGFILRPFDHMCEGLEKSNHHANRDFQTKTMRGGGKIYHKDPLFLESSSSFVKFLRIASELNSIDSTAEVTKNADVDDDLDDADMTMNKTTYTTVSKINPINVMELLQSATKVMDIQIPGPDYLDICRKEMEFTKIAIGAKKMFWLDYDFAF